MNNPISLEQKKAIVEAWRASGRTQQEFCQNHPTPLAPRTLRAWAREVRRPEEGLERALARVAEAIQEAKDFMMAIRNAGGCSAEPADVPKGSTVPAAARGRLAGTDVPAAAERHPEDVPGERGSRQRTLLDDIAAAVQAVAAEADADVQENAGEEHAVRPVPFSDPWTGGGFLGSF